MSEKYRKSMDTLYLSNEKKEQIAKNALRLGIKRRNRMRYIKYVSGAAACLLVCVISVPAMRNIGRYDTTEPVSETEGTASDAAETPKSSAGVPEPTSEAVYENAPRIKRAKDNSKKENAAPDKKTETTAAPADIPDKNPEGDSKQPADMSAERVTEDYDEEAAEAEIENAALTAGEAEDVTFDTADSVYSYIYSSPASSVSGGGGHAGGAASGAAAHKHLADTGAVVYGTGNDILAGWESCAAHYVTVSGITVTVKTDEKRGFLAYWESGGTVHYLTGGYNASDEEIIKIAEGYM